MLEIDFNKDWYVLRERPKPGSPKPIGPVTLPRDEMILETRSSSAPAAHNNGYYPGGIYRYTKKFVASQDWRSKHVIVRFESIYHRSKVYLNGTLLGGRPSGYCTIHVDMSAHLNLDGDGENILEVIADTLAQPSSRWYSGSGIYRPVQLLLSESTTSIQPFGIKLHTKSIEGSNAHVGLILDTISTSSSSVEVEVEVILRSMGQDGSPAEVVASRTTFAATITPGTARIERDLVVVEDARPWSVDSPSLYLVQSQLVERATGRLLDSSVDRFGIRTLSLTPEHGFLINGERVLMRGACVHHDNGVIGAVTLPAAEDRRVRILKQAGFNAIRSSHNSISIATLDACDKYGMIVMDEHTDNWYQSKVKYDGSLEFPEWWRKDFEAIVDKDYNHPSVVMYSIGNEIADSATPWGIAQAAEMNKMCKALDPHRYSTIAINGFLNMLYPKARAQPVPDPTILDTVTEHEKAGGGLMIQALNFVIGSVPNFMSSFANRPIVDRKTKDVFEAVDIAGYNYMTERYSQDVQTYPRRIIVGSETGAMAGVTTWPLVERIPALLGDFVWTGWDYIGEASLAAAQYSRFPKMYLPFPAHLAGEPFIDITGHIQPQCFHSATAWHLRQGRPYIAVRPLPAQSRPLNTNLWRATDAVHSWSWEGCEGQQTDILVYSDSFKIRLLLDGKVIGEQPAGEAHQHSCHFKTSYWPGLLEAVAYDIDNQEVGRDTLQSADTDRAPRIQLAPEVTQFETGGQDLIYIPITLTDQNGVLRPLQKATITLSVTGPATLLGFGNAASSNTRGFSTDEHDTYQGRVLAVLRSTDDEGPIAITARSAGLVTVTTVVHAAHRRQQQE
jgi:beta-galactosidase